MKIVLNEFVDKYVSFKQSKHLYTTIISSFIQRYDNINARRINLPFFRSWVKVLNLIIRVWIALKFKRFKSIRNSIVSITVKPKSIDRRPYDSGRTHQIRRLRPDFSKIRSKHQQAEPQGRVSLTTEARGRDFSRPKLKNPKPYRIMLTSTIGSSA